MKVLFLALLLALSMAAPAAALAEGALEAPVRNPLDPPAPPPSTEPKPDWMGYQTPYNGEQSDLSTPHRTPDEITAWVAQMAADVLTFTSNTAYTKMLAAGADVKYEEVNAKLNRLKVFFTPTGWQQYAAFATGTGVIDKVRTQDYSVTTIMNGSASVVDSGPAGGTYHWLVKAPMMVSYMLVNEAGEQQTVEDGQYDLMVQLGRIPPKGTEDAGILIEGWSAKERTP